jgi:hypothetical protein
MASFNAITMLFWSSSVVFVQTQNAMFDYTADSFICAWPCRYIGVLRLSAFSQSLHWSKTSLKLWRFCVAGPLILPALHRHEKLHKNAHANKLSSACHSKVFSKEPCRGVKLQALRCSKKVKTSTPSWCTLRKCRLESLNSACSVSPCIVVLTNVAVNCTRKPCSLTFT